jgi:hypothetical protein
LPAFSLQKYGFDRHFALQKFSNRKSKRMSTFKNPHTGHRLETFKYLKVSKRVIVPVFSVLGNFDMKKGGKEKKEQDVTPQNLPNVT